MNRETEKWNVKQEVDHQDPNNVENSFVFSRRPAKSHFTMVELLVVTAIIAILMAMLLPAFQRARKEAERTVCATNQGQIGVIMTTYTEDYTYYFPYNCQVSLGNPPGSMKGSQNNNNPNGLENWAWFMYFKSGYLSSLKTYYCPAVSEESPSYSENFLDNKDSASGVWEFTYISYGYNTAGIGHDWFGIGNDGDGVTLPSPARSGGVSRPSETILTCDSIQWSVYGQPNGEPDRPFYMVDWGNGLIQSRHVGAAVVLWVDGHVSSCQDAEDMQRYPKPRGTGYPIRNDEALAKYFSRY